MQADPTVLELEKKVLPVAEIAAALPATIAQSEAIKEWRGLADSALSKQHFRC